MAEEKILTKHPQGKTGRNINREIYETVKAAILATLGKKELTHNELFEQLNKKLIGKISGNISWWRNSQARSRSEKDHRANEFQTATLSRNNR
jgi:hypothetical protein